MEDGECVDLYGTKTWYKNGELHRDNDKPALMCVDGSTYWYQNGDLHRDNDKPAVIYSDGSRFWFKNGVGYLPERKSSINLTD